MKYYFKDAPNCTNTVASGYTLLRLEKYLSNHHYTKYSLEFCRNYTYFVSKPFGFRNAEKLKVHILQILYFPMADGALMVNIYEFFSHRQRRFETKLAVHFYFFSLLSEKTRLPIWQTKMEYLIK